MNQYGDENCIPQAEHAVSADLAMAERIAREPLSAVSAHWWNNRAPWFVTPRRQGDHFCLFMESGRVQVVCERGERVLGRGEWCLLRVGELFSFGLAAGCTSCSHVIVHASPKYSPLRDPAERLQSPFFRFDVETLGMMHCMAGLSERCREGGLAWFSAMLNLKLMELALEPKNWIGDADAAYHPHIAAMCGFAERNFRTRIGIGDLAASAGIGEAQCRRLFLRHLRCAPSDYLQNLRLFAAARALTETRKSVKEIALEHGFASSSYFCHVFRRKMNLTPEEYRKRT